jgi:DNA repair exonuclease SbcCD ATPase subunit
MPYATMSDSDMSDSDRPEPSRRPARASTVKQRAVDRPPIKKRTAKKAVVDVDADAKLKAVAVVIDDKDKQLRDKDEQLREKEHNAQFMASQYAEMEREKTSALNLAADKDREARSSAEQIQVHLKQIADLNAEKQEIMRASCAGMRTAMESFMEADSVLDTASGMVDDAGQILSSLEAVVNAEPRQAAPATGMQQPCAEVLAVQQDIDETEEALMYRELTRVKIGQQIRLAEIDRSIATLEAALAISREKAVHESDIAGILDAAKVEPLAFPRRTFAPAKIDFAPGVPSRNLSIGDMEERLNRLRIRP